MLVGGAAAYVAGAYALTRFGAALMLRRMMRSAQEPRDRLGALVMLAAQVYLVAALTALMAAGWGAWIVSAPALAYIPLLGKALAAGPFALALLAYWLAMFPLERAARMRLISAMAMAGQPVMPAWTRREYLSFQLRHNLLFIAAPVGAMFLVLDSLTLLHDVFAPAVLGGALAVAMAGVFVMAPAVIVRIWRTRPLPDGELLSRLEALCGRMRLRYRRILLWNTGGVIVNAGVIGIIPQARYVLLSDALLTRFDDRAVDAIFAHEAGHVVHHHIPYMVAFSIGLLMLCGSAGAWLGEMLALDDRDGDLLGLVLLAGMWGWLFGMLSRRFERQADVFAAAAVSGPDAATLTAEGVRSFSEALIDVGQFNGIPLERRNYRHGSIRRRVDYLASLAAAGVGPGPTDRAVRRVKIGIWILLAAGVAAAVLL